MVIDAHRQFIQPFVDPMKRLLLIVGPVVALIGSLGFLMSGGTLVGVFDVLTHVVPEPPPPSLSELPGAVASAMAVVIGLAISCIATVQRHGTRVISKIGRLLFLAGGLSLIAATIPVGWAVLQVKAAFRIIATASTAPTPEAMQAWTQSAEPRMVIGAIILLRLD